MRRDLFVYISGPITPKNGATIEDNVAVGLRMYWALLSLGIPAFCPHMVGAFPTAWTLMAHAEWLAYDYAVIDRCTHVVLLDGWRSSVGAVAEKRYAEARGIPVYTFDEFVAALAEAPLAEGR